METLSKLCKALLIIHYTYSLQPQYIVIPLSKGHLINSNRKHREREVNNKLYTLLQYLIIHYTYSLQPQYIVIPLSKGHSIQ